MQEPLCHGLDASADSAHETMKADDALWTSLVFDGLRHDGRGSLIESRRCPRCGSALSRPVSMSSASEVCDRQAAVQASSMAALEAARLVLGMPFKFVQDKPSLKSSDRTLPRKLVINLRISGTVWLLPPGEAGKLDTAPVREAANSSEPRPPQNHGDGWPENAKEFGRALRRTREDARLTRAQLSATSKVADSTIRNVEMNRHGFTLTVRRKLIKAMASYGYTRPIG